MRHFSEQELINLSILFERDPQYTIYGTYFGFPNCCIESFIRCPGVHQWYKEGEHTGTGYIPCMHCMEKSNTQWREQLALIESRRICSEPFPQERGRVRHWDVEVFFIEFCSMLGFEAQEKATHMHNEQRILKVLEDPSRHQATFKRIRKQFTTWHLQDQYLALKRA